jgi:hypothetical protein
MFTELAEYHDRLYLQKERKLLDAPATPASTSR